MKYFNSKLGARWISILLFASLLIASATCGVSLAKYSDDKTVDNISLTVMASYTLEKGSAFLSDLKKAKIDTTKVIFGYASDYPNIVSSSDYTAVGVAINNSGRKTNDIKMYYSSADTTVYVLSAGNIYANQDSSYLLGGGKNQLNNLAEVEFYNFNTSKVMDMEGMFLWASGLTHIDVSHFDVSNVTNMESMFRDCENLEEIDLSSWYTPKLKNMYQMFTYCERATSITFGPNFSTENVASMNRSFMGCFKLESLDLKGFNTSKVTDMSYMFSYCNKLKTITVGNSFDVSSVTSDSNAFLECYSICGGQNTIYNSSYVDKTYAHIDGGTANPGYFTDINATQSLTYSATGTDEAANGFGLAS